MVLSSHLYCIIDRADDLTNDIVALAYVLDFLSKLRLKEVFEHEVWLVEKAFFKVFKEGFSQILFGLSKYCSAFKRLKIIASRDLLLALAVQNLFLLDVVDLAEQLSVVLIVCSRKEVGLFAVVNSYKAISPVLKIFWVLSTLVFLDNESTLFKHDIDFVNYIHTKIFFVVLEIFYNYYLNIVA